MTIRPATLDDLPALDVMGRHFLQASPYGAVLEDVPAQREALFSTFIGLDSCWVLESDAGAVVGVLAMALGPAPWSGERVAVDAVWWVEPEARGQGEGVRLVALGEEWARLHRARGMQLLQPANAPWLATLYRQLGYRPLETTWHKRLEGEPHAE